MKVAVIGSGFYGTAIVLELKIIEGLKFDLHESQSTLMQRVSHVNK
jgi:L-2-hydroxyglutarate oxidase LhgO